MNKIAINTFDVRLSYLTEKEIEQWNSLNQLARTLWFENTISGPDLEYSRFSVEIFKLYPHYSAWSHVPRQNGGYVLQNNSSDSTLTINADLMNGWWNIFKGLTNRKLRSTTRSENAIQLYNDYYQLSDSEIANTLSQNFGHNQRVWDAFLKYLNHVYAIGNLSPAGANPGGGLDLWTNKLSKLKQQWFDQESELLNYQLCCIFALPFYKLCNILRYLLIFSSVLYLSTTLAYFLITQLIYLFRIFLHQIFSIIK